MKRWLLVIMVLRCAPATSQTPLSLASAGDTTICGEVISTYARASDGTIFLNLGSAFPNQTFTVVIHPGLLKFTDYKGQTIRITGRLNHLGHKDEIEVAGPHQIDLLSQPLPHFAYPWMLDQTSNR